MNRLLLSIFALLLLALTATAAETPDSLKCDSRGRYVWVPDSLANDFQKVLEGRYKIVRNSAYIDFSERTVVRGDTVPMVIRDKNYSRFDRGLFNYLFIPKGQWMVGITASYGEFSTEDVQILDLLTDLDFKGHAFSVKPYLSYFIKNNLSLGLRFGYSATKANIDRMTVDFDEDMNFDLTDIMYRSESLSTSFFARQYVGLSRKGRFGVFNEVELALSSGNSDFRRPYDGEPKVTHTTYTNIGLNFSPGVTVLINKYASFNLQFGVVGLYLRNEKQSVNGEYSGNRFTSGANFRFNLFNINFGLGIHL